MVLSSSWSITVSGLTVSLRHPGPVGGPAVPCTRHCLSLTNTCAPQWCQEPNTWEIFVFISKQFYTSQRTNWKICTVTHCEQHTLVPHSSHTLKTFTNYHLHFFLPPVGVGGSWPCLRPQTPGTGAWDEAHHDTGCFQYSPSFIRCRNMWLIPDKYLCSKLLQAAGVHLCYEVFL